MSSNTHTSTERLVLAKGAKWRTGLTNLMRKELSEWFGGLTLLWTTLIWVGLVNGIMLMAMLAERSEGAGVQRLITLGMDLYPQFTSMFVAVGVVIASLDAVVGERELGTAAFILSKPLSRISFILAKFLSNAAGILVTAVFIPGTIAYGQIWAIAGARLPLARYVAGMLVLFIGLMFYLALSLLLGVLFRNKGAVIGIPLALIFGHQLLISLVPQLIYVTPWGLPDLVKVYVLEGSLTSPLPLIGVPISVILLLMVAIARFEHEDL